MKITIQDLIDNIRKNGLPKITGSFYQFEMKSSRGTQIIQSNNLPEDKRKKVIGVCAFGQAAINLDIDADMLWQEMREGPFWRIKHRVAELNDSVRLDLTFDEIADHLEKQFESELNIEMEV